MRERELRQLFKRLVIAAAPVPVAASVAACSGDVQGAGASTGGASSTETGGSSSSTTKGLGGFMGTAVMTGGTSATGGSSSTTTKGLGGFMGTMAMTGGTAGVGGSKAGGIGGFMGTVALVGGNTSLNSAQQQVLCPDATTNSSGDAGPMLCAPAFCVLADTSGLDTNALDRTTCDSLCGSTAVLSCALIAGSAPSLLKCYPDCTGRRPRGLNDVQTFCDSELGQYFSEIAHLEAASVAAFRALGRELKAFGAPMSLRRAARRAARDEIRHARLGRALAERFGGRYVSPSVTAKRDVSIETIAHENAVEGCVRETYGALLATYQAERALDPEVRSAMREIARDETRHAAIAWSVARWVEPKLEPEARERIRQARRTAVLDLMREISYQAPEPLQTLAGVPETTVALGLARTLAAELWEPAHAEACCSSAA